MKRIHLKENNVNYRLPQRKKIKRNEVMDSDTQALINTIFGENHQRQQRIFYESPTKRSEFDDNNNINVYSSTKMEIFLVTVGGHHHNDFFSCIYVNRNHVRLADDAFAWQTEKRQSDESPDVCICVHKIAVKELEKPTGMYLLVLKKSSTPLRILVSVNDVMTEIQYEPKTTDGDTTCSNNIVGIFTGAPKIDANLIFFIPLMTTVKVLDKNNDIIDGDLFLKGLYKDLSMRMKDDFLKYHLKKRGGGLSTTSGMRTNVVAFDDKVYKSPYALANRLYAFVNRRYYPKHSWELCLRWKFYEREKDILDPFFLSLSQMPEEWIRELIRHFIRRIPGSDDMSLIEYIYILPRLIKYRCILTRLITTPQIRTYYHCRLNEACTTLDILSERSKLLTRDHTSFSSSLSRPGKNNINDYLVFKICKKGFKPNKEDALIFHDRHGLRDLLSHEDDAYELLIPTNNNDDSTAIATDQVMFCSYQHLLGYLNDDDNEMCLLLPKVRNNNDEEAKKDEINKTIRDIDNTLRLMYYRSSSKNIMLRRNVHFLKLGYAALKWVTTAEMTTNNISEKPTNGDKTDTNMTTSFGISAKEETIECVIEYLLNSGDLIMDHVAHVLFFSCNRLELENQATDLEYRIEGGILNQAMVCVLKMCIILNLLKFTSKRFQDKRVFSYVLEKQPQRRRLLPFEIIVENFFIFGRCLRLPYNDSYGSSLYNADEYIIPSLLGYACREKNLPDSLITRPENFNHFYKIFPFIEFSFRLLGIKSHIDKEYCSCSVFY